MLPSYLGRALTFSAFFEVTRVPALADLTRAAMAGFFGGDASEWERALLMPHYSAAGMPACSLHQVRRRGRTARGWPALAGCVLTRNAPAAARVAAAACLCCVARVPALAMARPASPTRHALADLHSTLPPSHPARPLSHASHALTHRHSPHSLARHSLTRPAPLHHNPTQALHFIQIIHTRRFQLFDYGSAQANMARYGTPRPPDVGSQYWRLAGLPVDLLAGTRDGIVPPFNVRQHYERMREQGLQVRRAAQRRVLGCSQRLRACLWLRAWPRHRGVCGCECNNARAALHVHLPPCDVPRARLWPHTCAPLAPPHAALKNALTCSAPCCCNCCQTAANASLHSPTQVTYREFDYGHMDFTFSQKDELRYYIMQCLNRK